MSRDFREALREGVILADGAMGTELYRRGVFINRCYDELNLGRPELVSSVHADYVAAGADVVTTNTYGAHRLRLVRHGLEDRLEQINREAVRLAREAAGEDRFVAGSVGPMPLPLRPAGPLKPEDARAAYAEQVGVLVDAGVDLIVLETFQQLRQLETAIGGLRDVAPHIPVVASFAFKPVRHYFKGPTPEDVAAAACNWDIDVLGTNCLNGPAKMVDLVERLAGACDLPLSAMPNAGTPEMVDGRSLYLASPEYMAEYGRRFVHHGVRVVGGCCGTTPDMTREMHTYLQSVEPERRARKVQVAVKRKVEVIEPTPVAERSRWGARLGTEFAVSVELDAPRGLSPERALRGAKLLAEHGVSAVNIPDGPRATARMSALALARRVLDEVDIDVIVHVCGRDRNVLGLQMDLLGAHVLGVRNLLLVTGDPPKMGNYPDATAVFDLDSVGLIRGVTNLNRGVDLGGDAIGESTDFVLGCGCNPGSENLDHEVEKFRRKVEAGAEFAFAQPAYEPDLIERFVARVRPFSNIPIFVGVLPLASSRNAEFLHTEVPGMQVPAGIRARMANAGGRDAQRAEGVRIAGETLHHARDLEGIEGAYIFPPFGRYSAVLDVVKVIEDAERLREI